MSEFGNLTGLVVKPDLDERVVRSNIISYINKLLWCLRQLRSQLSDLAESKNWGEDEIASFVDSWRKILATIYFEGELIRKTANVYAQFNFIRTYDFAGIASWTYAFVHDNPNPSVKLLHDINSKIGILENFDKVFE